MKAFALGLTMALLPTSYAQTKPPTSTSKDALIELQRSMPSEKEFSELLAKAEQKVSAFEAAVKNAKPHLDKIDTKYAMNYLDAAATAVNLTTFCDSESMTLNYLREPRCANLSGTPRTSFFSGDW